MVRNGYYKYVSAAGCWSIDTPISAYGLGDRPSVSDADAAGAAKIRTSLNRF